MTALSTLVESLKRELAVPGVFDDAFPDTSDEDLTASLADGLADAQLQGFFADLTLDVDHVTSEDISAAGGALVILFTSMRIIRAQIRSMNLSEKYKAAGTEYEVSRSTNLLRDELKFLRDRIKDLITENQRSARAASSVAVIDGYYARSVTWSSLGGFYPHEYRA